MAEQSFRLDGPLQTSLSLGETLLPFRDAHLTNMQLLRFGDPNTPSAFDSLCLDFDQARRLMLITTPHAIKTVGSIPADVVDNKVVSKSHQLPVIPDKTFGIVKDTSAITQQIGGELPMKTAGFAQGMAPPPGDMSYLNMYIHFFNPGESGGKSLVITMGNDEVAGQFQGLVSSANGKNIVLNFLDAHVENFDFTQQCQPILG